MFRRKKIDDETRKQILDEYEKNNKTVEQIAKDFEISRGFIYYNLGKSKKLVQKGGGNINVQLIGYEKSNNSKNDVKVITKNEYFSMRNKMKNNF